MIRVRGSSGGGAGSGVPSGGGAGSGVPSGGGAESDVPSGGGAGGGVSSGVVTGSTGVIADVEPPLGQPRHRVDAFAAAQHHLEMQVGAGGIAAVAHGGYLVARHHPLADADQRRVDVTVER